MYNSRVNVDPLRRKKLAFHAPKDRENFFYDGNGFFRLMKVLGCFPITKKDGRVQFAWFSWLTVYTVAYNLVMLGWAFWSCYVITWNLRNKNFGFEETILYCTLYFFAIVQVLPVLSFFEAKKLACYLNSWGDFQELFNQITGKKFSRKISRFWFLCLIVGPVLVVVGTYLWQNNFHSIIKKHNLDPTIHWFFMHTTSFVSITISLYGYLWFLLTRTVVDASEILIQDVESLQWTANQSSVRNHVILWFYLRQLCLKLGSTLNWTFFYVSIVFFGISLPMIYVGAVQILQGSSFTLIASFNSLLFVSSLAELTHHAVDKVSDEFEARVTALISKVADTEHENELLRFSEKIATHPVTVYLGGFFPLNRSINPAMYSSVITYLIIIIQFRGVNNEIPSFEENSTS